MNGDIDELKRDLKKLELRLQTLERLFRRWQNAAGISTTDFNTFASIKHLEWKLAALADESRRALGHP